MSTSVGVYTSPHRRLSRGGGVPFSISISDQRNHLRRYSSQIGQLMTRAIHLQLHVGPVLH